MSSQQSKDQKCKAKKAEREKKSREREVFQPYEGRKYQQDIWTPVTFATERAIYETILESNRSVSNNQVKQALLTLIEHLRSGGPAALGPDEPEVQYSVAATEERLFYNIRRAWRKLAESGRVVASVDLIGVLRTLLGSIETQGLRLGASRGYVAFLEEFMQQFSQ